MANLEESESQIPDVKLIFCLIVHFYLIKTKNRTKKTANKTDTIGLSKGTILAKKMLIFCKKILA